MRITTPIFVVPVMVVMHGAIQFWGPLRWPEPVTGTLSRLIKAFLTVYAVSMRMTFTVPKWHDSHPHCPMRMTSMM